MRLRVPEAAWSRALGEGYEPAPRPRVATPMIDDGPWAGVPIGGMGAGSIGRTQRGDFARWHLRVGEHRFASSAMDGFALRVDDGQTTTATLLRTTPGPPGWGPPLPVGAGRYRALAPRAWFEHDLPGLPVRVLEEQLSPVIPGDEALASLPVGAFTFELENRSDRPVRASLLLAWEDSLADVVGSAGRVRSFAADGVAGGVFDGASAASDPATDVGTFAIAAASDDGEVSWSGPFDPEGGAEIWDAFAATGRLPHPAGPGPADPDRPDRRSSAAAIAVAVDLAPGETRTVRFAIAWDLPIVRFGGGRRWWKRYTREWGRTGRRAADLAATALRSVGDWRAAIEGWQAPVLADPDRPAWYQAALFNELYFLVDGGTIWAEGPVEPEIEPGAPEGPVFGLIECFDYPFYNTLDVHFYAASALSRLWPGLQASISRAYARTVAIDDPRQIRVQASGAMGIRKVAGALPHDLGGPAEDPFVEVNHYTFQEVNAWKDLNPKFVLQAWRDRVLDPDPAGFVRDVWPAVCTAMDHVAAFDRDGDGLPEHGGVPDQTYDTWPMSGPSAYGGSLWLAALRAAAAFAAEIGDGARERAWTAAFEQARTSFLDRLWNGRSFDYDDGGGPTSDSIMADQLAGQWFADASGLGDLVPAGHVRSALLRVFEANVCDFGDGLIGAVNGMRPDGTVDRTSEQSEEVWVGTTYALAAFMIGRGLTSEGWTTAAGAARVVWERGFWFRSPEAYDRNGNFRASLYLRPLAIWAIEDALERASGGATARA